MHRRTWLRQSACWLGIGGLWLSGARQARSVTSVLRVAAASDLKFVLGVLLADFQRQTGWRAEAVFGSSGNFASQIRQGLPVDLFMSADERWVEQLAQTGFTRNIGSAAQPVGDRGVIYAHGRIALLVPKSSTLMLDTSLDGLRSGWAAVEKFAIANPEHAPYGRAAEQALRRLGMWDLVRPKLVLGENIAQATQFVTSGAAQAGITALSLALADEVAQLSRHAALPAQLHDPLRQRMVLTNRAAPQAQQLYDFLQADSARAIFRRHGFEY